MTVLTPKQEVLNNRVKSAIRDVYKGECQYCGCGGATHVDHIIPRAKGGTNKYDNLILACGRCNIRKGAGEIKPQYLALITAIADKNKERVSRRVKCKKENIIKTGEFIYLGNKATGITTNIVWISNPPTMEEADYFDAVVTDMIKNKEREASDACT